MKKGLNFLISALVILIMIGFMNMFINYFFLWENDGQKYYKQYINESAKIKVRVDERKFGKRFSHTHYLKYTIYYKGITGGSEDETFEDSYTHKYFKIMRFDLKDQSIAAGQTSEIRGKELYIMANNKEINNPHYGTLSNPIHVFSFKGVNEKIQMNTETDNGTIGWINLEPTQQEYEYNVIQYLTYVMSGKEFKERFEK